MIITFKASKSSQCPQDSFKTQALIIEDKTSTIIWDMCQVKSGGTQPILLIVICWL